jgi:hypothetical protein
VRVTKRLKTAKIKTKAGARSAVDVVLVCPVENVANQRPRIDVNQNRPMREYDLVSYNGDVMGLGVTDYKAEMPT